MAPSVGLAITVAVICFSACWELKSPSQEGKSICEKIKTQNACQKNDRCDYNNNSKRCRDAEAAQTGTCAAIKIDTICNNHKQSIDQRPCVWDSTKVPSCVVKTQTIPPIVRQFTYYEMTFPTAALKEGKDEFNDQKISALGRSGDGTLLYFSTHSDGYISSLLTGQLTIPASSANLGFPNGDNNKPGESLVLGDEAAVRYETNPTTIP